MSIAVLAKDLVIGDLIQRSPGTVVTILDIRRPTAGKLAGKTVVQYPLHGFTSFDPEDEVQVFNRKED